MLRRGCLTDPFLERGIGTGRKYLGRCSKPFVAHLTANTMTAKATMTLRTSPMMASGLKELIQVHVTKIKVEL